MIDGYCTCYPNQNGCTPSCGVEAHRREAVRRSTQLPTPEDFGVTPKRLAELSGELTIRQIAERAFEAGHRLGHWEPGVSGDPPPYENFDEYRGGER